MNRSRLERTFDRLDQPHYAHVQAETIDTERLVNIGADERKADSRVSLMQTGRSLMQRVEQNDVNPKEAYKRFI